MTETKICSKCGQEKSVEEFRWRDKAKGRRHAQCKECMRAQEKIRYQNDIERQEKVLSRAKNQYSKNTDLVTIIKQNKVCVKCGESRFYVLDFHHRDRNEKINDITSLIKGGSQETLLAEIDKCDLLCANCHREFHFLERTLSISYQDYINHN